MTATYTFQKGEPIVYALRVVSGNPAGYTVAAKLKPVGSGAVTPPASSVASVADFSATFVAAAGEVAAHWLLSISATVSATLPAGRYMADEKLTFGGTTMEITDPVVILIRNSVTG